MNSKSDIRIMVPEIARASKFFKVVPHICESSAWCPLRVTILATRILWWPLDFWQIFAALLDIYRTARGELDNYIHFLSAYQ
jgi:hypothetical protein